jgi:hypothetical protein
MYVTDLDPKKAYIMKVEMADSSSYSVILQLLSNNGYDVAEWDPTVTAIPEDMDLLVIDNPLNDFPDSMIDTLYNYLENGGNYGKNLVYLANNSQKLTPNINEFIKEWGISVRQGEFIAETNAQNYIDPMYPNWIKATIIANDYSGGVSNLNLPVNALNAVPLDILWEYQSNVTTVDLLDTAGTAYVIDEAYMEKLNEDPYTQPEETGSYCIMATGNKYMFDDANVMVKSNVLVVGGSSMLSATSTQSSFYSNAEYFMSVVNTMTGKTGGIVVAAKADSTGTFAQDAARTNTMGTLFIIVLPICTLIVGAVVLLRRRHK